MNHQPTHFKGYFHIHQPIRFLVGRYMLLQAIKKINRLISHSTSRPRWPILRHTTLTHTSHTSPSHCNVMRLIWQCLLQTQDQHPAGRACSRSRETLWDTQLWSQCQGNGRLPVLWCIVCTHKCNNLLVAWCHLLPGNQTVAKLHTIAVPYVNHWHGGADEHVQATTQQAQTQWSTYTGLTTILWSTAIPPLSGQCYEVGVPSSEWSTGENAI